MVSSRESLPEQPKISTTQSETDRLQEERLIAKYIRPGEHLGLAEARIGREGPQVWRIIRFYQQVDGDITKVTDQFGISEEVAEVALSYYDRFSEFINARILLSVDKPLLPEEFRKLISSV